MSGPQELIEVEWIGVAQKMLQVIERVDVRLDKQEKALQKLSDTGKKGADGVAGSFNKLEEELKQNEAILKKLQIGTKAFSDQKAKVDELRKSLNSAKGELGGIASNTNGILSAGITKVAALAASMLSFQAIVSAVVSELEKTKQLKLDAAATTRTFEQALADVGQNIGGGAIPEAKKMILENAPKLGTTNEGLADLLGVAISAGAKDLKEAMALVSATLKLTVGDAQKARALVGGTLDVASLGGSQNFEGALGQLLQTQSQVRSTNLAEFSANIGPGLAAATADLSQQKGVSTERALEMSSVISQIIKDQTGSNTATTMRMMFTRMGSFVPEKEKKLDDGGIAKVTKEQITAFQSLKTFDERLKMMQDIPAIGQQFLETQRESIGKTAIAEIIGKSERAVAFEEKAKANISSIDAAQGFFGDLDNALRGETAQLGAERRAQANIAASEVAGNRDLAGTVIKIVDDAIAKVDLSGLDMETAGTIRNRIRLGEATGANPIDTGITALQEAQQQRKAFGVIPAGQQVSPEDKKLLQDQITVLREMKVLLELQLQKQPAPQPQQPQQRPPVPRVRPQVAPLPAATAP